MPNCLSLPAAAATMGPETDAARGEESWRDHSALGHSESLRVTQPRVACETKGLSACARRWRHESSLERLLAFQWARHSPWLA